MVGSPLSCVLAHDWEDSLKNLGTLLYICNRQNLKTRVFSLGVPLYGVKVSLHCLMLTILCRMDTGIAGRVKPFAIEIRNVKCAKCGAFGHQSGDRECPLKDVITPSEVERLKRNDPLNIIIAQATSDEVSYFLNL